MRDWFSVAPRRRELGLVVATGAALVCGLVLRGPAVDEAPVSGAALVEGAGTVVDRSPAELPSTEPASQADDGCFGPRTSRKHAEHDLWAALAMASAYELTGSRHFKDSALRGVDFVHATQNPHLGWRFGVRDGDTDTSVTAWKCEVLRLAWLAGLEVDSALIDDAAGWVESATDTETGHVGYRGRPGHDPSTSETWSSECTSDVESGAGAARGSQDSTAALTAAGLAIRALSRRNSIEAPLLLKTVDVVGRNPPVWDAAGGSIDMHRWYFGNHAISDTDNVHARAWFRAQESELAAHQCRFPGTDADGSWAPVGRWGNVGGRVYSTAIVCMTLQSRFFWGDWNRGPDPGRGEKRTR